MRRELPSWSMLACLALAAVTVGPGWAQWVVETVATDANEAHCSVTVDASDDVHIAYTGYSDVGLYYFKETSSGWSRGRVTDATDPTMLEPGNPHPDPFPSLALDSDGLPCISFSYGQVAVGGAGARYFVPELRYAYCDAGGWHIVTPTTEYSVYATSLALDAADVPCIVYESFWWDPDLHPDPNVYLGRMVDGLEADVEHKDCRGPVMALDSHGRTHVAYYEEASGNLVYAQHSMTGWAYRTLATPGFSQRGLSLALDGSEYPHISYFDDCLKHAWYDGLWHVETVDLTADVGLYSSITCSSGGYPRIAYSAGGDLKYASRSAAAWSTETVDSTGTVGDYPSLVLDSANHPHIAYYDETNGALKHAGRHEIMNREPSCPAVALTPTGPHDDDEVRADATGSTDPDGDTIYYWFGWFVADGATWVQKRGRISTATHDTLPASLTAAGQAWKCSVIASNLSSGSPNRSRTVEKRFTIASSAPSRPTVTLTPASPDAGDDVRADVTGVTDPEGDAITYHYGWMLAVGAIWELQRGRTTSAAHDTLPGSLTSSHQAWKLVVYASDGVHDGPTREVRFTTSDAGAGGAGLCVTSLSAVPAPLGAEIAFALSAPARVQAEVLNVAGRPVRLIGPGDELQAGTHTLLWNGQSDQGLPVPNGRYMIRLTARDQKGGSSQGLTVLDVRR